MLCDINPFVRQWMLDHLPIDEVKTEVLKQILIKRRHVFRITKWNCNYDCILLSTAFKPNIKDRQGLGFSSHYLYHFSTTLSTYLFIVLFYISKQNISGIKIWLSNTRFCNVLSKIQLSKFQYSISMWHIEMKQMIIAVVRT